jgi:putative copper export protein
MLEALAAFVKLLLYAGAVCAAGTMLAALSLRRHLGQITGIVSSVAAWAAATVVLASVMHIAILLMRLGGDFSGPTLSAVLTTPVGLAAGLQVTGALVLLFAARLSVDSASQIRNGMPHVARHSGRMLRPDTAVAILGSLAILASFGVSGHASAVNVMSGFIAFLHVCAVAWWAGALLLLHAACKYLAGTELIESVRVFSRYAMAIVAVLVGAGIWLILVLVDFRGPDWFTPYVRNLTLKVGLAAAVIAVAIYNKLRLTPRLASDPGSGARALRLSITIELLIILAVLTATAWLTTFHSPHH